MMITLEPFSISYNQSDLRGVMYVLLLALAVWIYRRFRGDRRPQTNCRQRKVRLYNKLRKVEGPLRELLLSGETTNTKLLRRISEWRSEERPAPVISPDCIDDEVIETAQQMFSGLLSMRREIDDLTLELGFRDLYDYQQELQDHFESAVRVAGRAEDDDEDEFSEACHLFSRNLIVQLQDYRHVPRGELLITVQKHLNGFIARESPPRHVRNRLEIVARSFVDLHVPTPRPGPDFRR